MSLKIPMIRNGVTIYEKRAKEAGFSAYFDYSWQGILKKFEEGRTYCTPWLVALTLALHSAYCSICNKA
ncbi:MAG: hypothetical protein ACLU6Y_18690 [Ruminococcus sp.]